MTELSQTIESKGFQNWIRGAVAVLLTKQGLEDFVGNEIIQFQKDLLALISSKKGLPFGTICNGCTTENVLSCPTKNFCSKGKCKFHDTNKSDKRPSKRCPNRICQDIQDAIRQEHRYSGPSWKNTNADRWCTDAFEIAKCYMPPDGYAAVTTLDNTDFNGTLAVIINNKRFQNKMAEQLDQSNNICIQARDVGQRIRHSADLAVSDTELIKYIDILIDVLSDTKYLGADPKAKEAVAKLQMLKANTLNITTADITTVLDNALTDIVARRRDNALQDINSEKEKAEKEIDEKRIQLLEGVKASIANMQTLAASSLDAIIATKVVSAVNELKMTTERGIASLETKTKQLQEKLRKESDLQPQQQPPPKDCQQDLEKYMREDLISFYRMHHSTIPVAPLVEEHDVLLSEFYVRPPLTSVNAHKRYAISEQQLPKAPINSYHDLFFPGGDNMCKSIFVTANAGVGKTSFAKGLCMTWCQAHTPIESLKANFKQEDVDAMGKFDLFFLLSLRDQDPSLCDLDNMILESVLGELARSSRYTKYILEDALHNSTCLVVLDGLDEWSHPENCRRSRRSELPHIPARERCSILTTTRPWKLDLVNPRRSQIDKQVEIHELDYSLSEELITNAITVLNNQAVTNQPKTSEEFQTAISALNLDTVRYIPYILLQMVCLWFDGKSIGQSKCEIYRNMIELTLLRGLMKLQKKGFSLQHRQDVSNPNIIPHCLLMNKHCQSHYDVLLGLAKLAFVTLFSLEMKSRLVFVESVVLENIHEDTLAFCLKMGILSQNKDYVAVASKCSNYSFQHLSIQEYFAALYIQSYPDSQSIQEQILQVCRTLPATLDMSNVFICLGGFSPDTCGKILQMLLDAKEHDEKTREFRDSIRSSIWPFARYHKNVEFIMVKFQNMQTNTVQEIIDNGHSTFPFSIEDIFIDENFDDRRRILLKPLIDNSRDNIKSLSLELRVSAEQFSKILETLGLQNVQSLQKVTVETLLRDEDLNRVLSGSVRTLTCLILYKNLLHGAKYIPVSPKTTSIITSMDKLQSVSLNKSDFTHSDITILFEYLSKKTRMVEVALASITCKDHEDKCPGHRIDLSRHQKLKLLKLERIPVSELHVYSLSLETCMLGELPTHVHSAVTRCLKEASNLYELRIYDAAWQSHMQEILPSWKRLKSLFIMYLNLNDFILPSEMIHIEEVRFSRVSMSITALRRLIQSIDELPQAVTLKLHECTTTTFDEYQQIKDEIRSSSKHQILADEDIYFKYMTLK